MLQSNTSRNPTLEPYRKLAKELVRAQRVGETSALERIKRLHPQFRERTLEEIQAGEFKLADAQLVIARELSFESWPKLKKYLTTIYLIQSVGSLADPVSAFLEVACVPRHAGHQDGTLEHAEMILARYPEVRRANIFTAAVLGDEAAVRGYLAEDTSAARATGGPHGWDALTHLCFSRYLRIERARSEEFVRTARALLDAGASANTGWYERMDFPTPHLEFESVLYGAAGVAQNADLVRLLLERGADPNDAETAYHVSESYDHSVMQVLLESGKFNEESLVTLLVRKADWHDISGMRMVLEHGGNPNWTPMWGSSALLHALLRDNRLAMFELLLDFGADFAVRSARYEKTGFELAARRGRGDVLDLLERRGIALELKPVDQAIAACARGELGAASALAGGEPGIREEIAANGGKLLADFGGNGNVEGVRCLLELGARPDSLYGPIGDGYWDLTPTSMPLHVAAWRGWPAVVKELIRRGAPVNARDGKGRTPLMLAVRACVDSYWMERRTPEAVAELLAAGATVDGVKTPCGYDEVDALIRQHRGAERKGYAGGVILTRLSASVAWLLPGWWLPVDGAAHGAGLDRHLLLNLWIALGLLGLMHLMLLGGLLMRRRFPAPGGLSPTAAGEARLRGRNRTYGAVFEYGTLAVLTVLFAWLTVRAERLWAATRYAGADPAAMQVEATGVQFAWYFRYPGKDAGFGRTRPELIAPGEGNPLGIDPADAKGKDDFVSSELVLPVEREVDLRLRAQDVIHGFAVPELRIKQNAVPGENFHVHFTPTRTGTYAVLCTQLCGLGHYRMNATLKVVSESEFEQWTARKEAR